MLGTGGRLVEVAAVGHTSRHPSLMDGGHYGSWGQVPLTIKGPSQWLGKNRSGKRREKTERETVAAERVNTNAAGGEAPRQGGQQGGTGFFRWRERHMV